MGFLIFRLSLTRYLSSQPQKEHTCLLASSRACTKTWKSVTFAELSVHTTHACIPSLWPEIHTPWHTPFSPLKLLFIHTLMHFSACIHLLRLLGYLFIPIKHACIVCCMSFVQSSTAHVSFLLSYCLLLLNTSYPFPFFFFLVAPVSARALLFPSLSLSLYTLPSSPNPSSHTQSLSQLLLRALLPITVSPTTIFPLHQYTTCPWEQFWPVSTHHYTLHSRVHSTTLSPYSATAKSKTTTPGIPTWSPTVVLTERYWAWLRRSDGMRYFLNPMAVDDSMLFVWPYTGSVQLNTRRKHQLQPQNTTDQALESSRYPEQVIEPIYYVPEYA